MTCSRCGRGELVGKVNGKALCFDCYVEERPERPPFMPYEPVDEQRAQWAAWIEEGGTPVVIHVEEQPSEGIFLHDPRRRPNGEEDDDL